MGSIRNPISRICRLFVPVVIAAACCAVAQDSVSVVVFSEEGFPSADCSSPSRDQLKNILPAASFTSAEALKSALAASSTKLLVLPYGSAFPESAWSEIYAYLQRGGNLLVLGGQPFTRAAYHDAQGWHLRDYSVRFIQPLSIDQFQETPGSEGLTFEPNPDVVTQLPRFGWRRAFSPIIRLSAVDLYHRGGSAGSIDARLDPLAWGSQERRLSAPVVQIDHLRNRFTGGRWIFLNADLKSDFWRTTEATQIIQTLVEAALLGSEEFTVRPTLPLYLPAETPELEITWNSLASHSFNLSVRITLTSGSQSASGPPIVVPLPADALVAVRVPNSKGFYVVTSELLEGTTVRARYRSGFWIRDEAYLRSGPHLSVNHDYFELDGHSLAVVGTTYMSSDVQRLYFDQPNVYVWDRDLAQISAAGLNMIRTGWWTGWDKLCDETGQPYERTLRTLEAYLMTVREHGLPVQFNFFAFLPDVLGGQNAYLDPDAVRRQQTLIRAVVGRFHDVPFLAWDLINEPSFSQHLWRTRPNGDAIEFARWNQWLNDRYPDRKALAHAWNLPGESINSYIALPSEAEFNPRSMYSGPNSLKLYDYYLFAEESFADWAKGMRGVIRASGSAQPVTVGQDEGGFADRISPAFFASAVDFTTNHSWWQNDSLLWDSLVAKQPGLAMLIQETGLQRELTLDEIARRTTENEGMLFERKVATSFIQGSGAIEWLWNTNSYMTEGNEVPIGALRADGTEKLEATVMRDFAKFAKDIQGDLRNPQLPQVAIVTSQAAQFSVFGDTQIEAQRKAVRALSYYARVPGYIIAENQIANLGSPKLVILPSPQALNQSTWQALLDYVNGGGNLLITGPLDRDEHWRVVSRAHDLGLAAEIEPLTYSAAEIRLKDKAMLLSFDLQAQSSLESLRFKNGSSFTEFARGKGRIFWASYPVELAQGLDPAASVYSYVLNAIGLTCPFDLRKPLSPGVLIFPTVLQDSVLYVMVSDSAENAEVDFVDRVSHAHVSLRLPSQRAALALIRRSDGKVQARYGF
jgi:Beta-galactosidase